MSKHKIKLLRKWVSWKVKCVRVFYWIVTKRCSRDMEWSLRQRSRMIVVIIELKKWKVLLLVKWLFVVYRKLFNFMLIFQCFEIYPGRYFIKETISCLKFNQIFCKTYHKTYSKLLIHVAIEYWIDARVRSAQPKKKIRNWLLFFLFLLS